MSDDPAVAVQRISLPSSLGFSVALDLRKPPGAGPARGIAIFSHGFGGTKYPRLMNHLASAGYAVISIDFPGFGGTLPGSGRVIPSEQVHIVREAASYAENELMPEGPLPIVLVGATMGAAVSLLAARDDPRFTAFVLAHPLVNGEDRLRVRYPDEQGWQAFWRRVEQAERDGEKLHRSEIVFIPENLRGNLPGDTPMEFLPAYPRESSRIRSIDTLPSIAPRPILVVHDEGDSIVPTAQVKAFAESAASHCHLHLRSKGEHFIFDQPEVLALVTDWLDEVLSPA